MANIHEISRNAFMLRGPFGKETLIDEVEAVGIGCEFGEYDKA